MSTALLCTCPDCGCKEAVCTFSNGFGASEDESPIWEIYECPACGSIFDEDYP